jgi:Lrp/AsnC family transcriptional regulator, regulator for asnA, asnC and gidA
MTITTSETDDTIPEPERATGDAPNDDLGEIAVVTASQRLLDPLDLAIARALERDARISVQELSRQVGTSRTTVSERLNRLVEQGFVRGFHARLDYPRLGYPLTAFVAIQAQQPMALEVIAALKQLAEVEEIHAVTGRFDLLVKVRARSTEHLQLILINKIQTIPNIGRGETMLSLATHLEDAPIGLSRLTFDNEDADERGGANGRPRR